MIGSLSHLIRGAAVEAILDGTEKITRKTRGWSESTLSRSRPWRAGPWPAWRR
jgi:hypothetical protein